MERDKLKLNETSWNYFYLYTCNDVKNKAAVANYIEETLNLYNLDNEVSSQ